MNAAAIQHDTTTQARDDLDSLLDDLPIPTHPIASQLKLVGPASIAVRDSVRTYEFPCDGWEHLAEVDDHILLDRLRELTGPLTSPTTSARYMQHRVEIIQLGLALNRRGKIAPRFRPLPKPAHTCAAGGPDEVLGRDRQVIDCHWLHERGHRYVIDTELDFRELFTGESFDFKGAAEFARAKWTGERKLQALGIDDALAAELAALQTDSIRETWKRIDRSKAAWRSALKNATRRQRNVRSHIEDWIDVRVAMELIGLDAPAHELASLVARMRGTKPIDVRGMKRKVDTIKKHLGISI
ncbi:hypothetical protein [Burkholderia pseudomallei]|uniref:hypothetical protein n=1 Tax=Burkholderia pseudomallei TaxID=28450 RepID=UPI000F1272CB|nr:hypothetical protein [Burkholderia pseudomallei]VBY59849.1 Uncharacterised protein [Burkholderia pseudomallei]VBY95783.1 Uncharacterised protein [Burkholderia pseudomallei]